MARVLKSATLDVDAMTDAVLSYWHAAEEWMRVEGANWYASAQDWALAQAHVHGITLQQVAAVIAATSPQTRWIDNLLDADNVLRDNGRRKGAMSSNIERARRVMLSADPIVALTQGSKTGKPGGPKMFAFASNIAGDLSHVTVDTWAARAALATDDRDYCTKVIDWAGAYERIADAYRKAAAEVGVEPAVMQATVWIAIRGKSD